MSIATEKTIASYRSGADIFKFFDLGTKLVETEAGFSVNEPVNYAVRAAVEQGVIELIYEGERKRLWSFKEDTTESIETINENSETDGVSEEG
jgi:curli production assembly/transport component CsgG